MFTLHRQQREQTRIHVPERITTFGECEIETTQLVAMKKEHNGMTTSWETRDSMDDYITCRHDTGLKSFNVLLVDLIFQSQNSILGFPDALPPRGTTILRLVSG